MSRKKWVSQSNITPDLLKAREKRKWQIALRRYVLEKNQCPAYAPYFGLDISKMREWFEMQFEEGMSWEDFGKKWQFDHIVPVAFFDFGDESELKMCWNFTNIRIQKVMQDKDRGHHPDILAAKRYFQALFVKTSYKPCRLLLDKINKLELSETVNAEKQEAFIIGNKPYLDLIENYSSFEFELLNRGRTVQEVIKEVEFLKKF